MNLSSKYFLFDCDGTLLKTLGFGMDAFNLALAHVGARPHTPEEIKRFFGQSADKIFLNLLGDKKKADAAYEVYFQFEVDHISRIYPHAGMVDLLEHLKTAGVRMGVVTGRHSRDLDLLFNHTKFHHYFEALVCDNELINHKPHPEGLLEAASRMKVDIKDCYYVGDSVMDLQAAKAAGAKSIAALWDQWVRPDEMQRELPDFMAKAPMDIWEWLKQ